MATLKQLIGKDISEMTNEELERIIADSRNSRSAIFDINQDVRKERTVQSLEKKLEKKFGPGVGAQLLNLLDDDEDF